MNSTILLHHTAVQLAAAAAARLITRLVDLQSSGLIPSVALTGGGVGIDTLRHVNSSAARDAVNWRAVEFFWGDERFVEANSDDRNEKQAREALLDHVDVSPDLVHAMAPANGEFDDDPDAAAAAYARILAERAPLDIVLLGMGGEGHIASIFPHSEALTATETVVAVRNCPKPPPTRVSLTLPTIQAAAEVWLLVAGSGKAEAVGKALGGSSPAEVPAAGARGSASTLWLLDRAAAAQIPPGPENLPV
ncbi:MAG: 6-phosphogluconolactonase [Nakamurella sp.]